MRRRRERSERKKNEPRNRMIEFLSGSRRRKITDRGSGRLR